MVIQHLYLGIDLVSAINEARVHHQLVPDNLYHDEMSEVMTSPTMYSTILSFSPFLTISLCRAGQYFNHPVFSIWGPIIGYFFMSPCMLSLHLFFGRPRLLLPETSRLSDFAQMWLHSRLKQWPNHFGLLFSRKVSTIL